MNIIVRMFKTPLDRDDSEQMYKYIGSDLYTVIKDSEWHAPAPGGRTRLAAGSRHLNECAT